MLRAWNIEVWVGSGSGLESDSRNYWSSRENGKGDYGDCGAEPADHSGLYGDFSFKGKSCGDAEASDADGKSDADDSWDDATRGLGRAGYARGNEPPWPAETSGSTSRETCDEVSR